MFRRRKGGTADDEPGDAAELDTDDPDDESDDEKYDDDADPARPHGPWDIEDAPADDLVRLDLGSLRIPGTPEVEIQVNLDEASGTVVAVTAVHGQSALQLQAFAAARGEPLWPQVRRELAAGITKDGGLADLDDSAEGVAAGSIKARLPFPQPDGKVALSDVRFFGTDGPRWMLRGVLSGQAAADPSSAGTLLDLYRGTVVVRGGDAFAPSEPLPLRLPDQPGPPPADDPSAGPDRTRLDPMDEGPRITEIR